jgi:hypothetical protein
MMFFGGSEVYKELTDALIHSKLHILDLVIQFCLRLLTTQCLINRLQQHTFT